MVSFEIVFQIFILGAIDLFTNLIYRWIGILIRTLSDTQNRLLSFSTDLYARFFEIRLEFSSPRAENIALDLVTNPRFICWLLCLHTLLISYFEIGLTHFVNLMFSINGALHDFFRCYRMRNHCLPCLWYIISCCVSHVDVWFLGIPF